ncbi:MAG: hypothetical protein CME89_14720 [Hirschia sp.]|nr:hypothetical protein [Hirschia sp.]
MLKLTKAIITALFCAVLIGTNAWLAAMSWAQDAYMSWSQQVRWAVAVNLAAHAVMAVSALLALGKVKLLWGAVIGATMKSAVALWVIGYMGSPDLTSGAWLLVCFWILIALACYFVIRWNYPGSEVSEHPEREFA